MGRVSGAPLAARERDDPELATDMRRTNDFDYGEDGPVRVRLARSARTSVA